MDRRCLSRAVIGLAIALAASTAFGQATGWIPPPASPALPPAPPYHLGIEDPAFLAALQGIYESSAETMGKRLAQFTSDAKALQASHAVVLNALVATKSPDALVNCVRTQMTADNTALVGSLRKDLEKSQENLDSQRQAVVGALRSAYPFDPFRAQAFATQYMGLATNTAIMAQTLIRANNLQ